MALRFTKEERQVVRDAGLKLNRNAYWATIDIDNIAVPVHVEFKTNGVWTVTPQIEPSSVAEGIAKLKQFFASVRGLEFIPLGPEKEGYYVVKEDE